MTSYRSNHRKKKSNTEDLDQSEACELYPHSDYYNSYTDLIFINTAHV